MDENYPIHKIKTHNKFESFSTISSLAKEELIDNLKNQEVQV